jgi:HAD superfamily hydrolase (TIGR01509 family)
VLEAVLFDWTNTLVEFTWDDDLLAAGHEAALAAIGRGDDSGFTDRYRPLVLEQATTSDDYGDLLRSLLGDLSDDEVERFIDTEHAVWQPAHALLGSAHALLESLRSRGLKTGIVANSWPEPGRVLRADLDAFGLSQLFDVVVFSTDVGFAKPAPEIFMCALDEIGVDPLAAMHVGDSLAGDVQGAANLGMTTVQALWFRADDNTSGIEPDFMAFTAMDVVNAVRRLAR